MSIYLRLKAVLKKQGAECRMVSVSHIPELESDYVFRNRQLMIDKQLYESYIQKYIDFSVSGKYPSARSVIIVATPSPLAEINFNLNHSSYLLKIPPIYSDRVRVTEKIKQITSQLFETNGYKTFPIVLPKKLLAVRSGLARYGKNNLAFVPGMGSYHRLTAFATDLSCEYDSWQDIQVLPRCKTCKACETNCPTGAISNQHFLIKAERCLSYFNEQPGRFPDWIDPASHNSIIGCIRCQSVCPENKNFIIPGKHRVEFSEYESGKILENASYENLPEDLKQKIESLCLKYYYKNLSRNISAVMKNEVN